MFSITASPKRWTSIAIGLTWFVDIYEPMTRGEANGLACTPIMDGHSLHYSAELLCHAKAHNGEILGYPPHTTHALQGLDVVCFAKMKKIFQEEVTAYKKRTTERVTKDSFCKVSGKAYLHAFDIETVKAVFQATGIHLYNPDIIPPKKTKPSAAFSTHGRMPGSVSSPVMAVIGACQTYTPTTFELEEDTHILALALSNAPQLSGPGSEVLVLSHWSSVSTSSPTKGGSSISRAVETPAAWMCMMHAALVQTSGSILLNKDPTKTANLIAPPILVRHKFPTNKPSWSQSCTPLQGKPTSVDSLLKEISKLHLTVAHAEAHNKAKNTIIKYQNATGVISNMQVNHLNTQLHAKLNKSMAKGKYFLEGKGQLFTSKEFILVAKKMEAAAKAKVLAQEERQSATEERQHAKKATDKQWECIQTEHKKVVEEWEHKREHLQKQGVEVKDLPLKPKHALKPKLARPELVEVVEAEVVVESIQGEQEGEAEEDSTEEDGGDEEEGTKDFDLGDDKLDNDSPDHSDAKS